MEQRTLFDLPEPKDILPISKPSTGLTCRTCIHRYKHMYGKMFYCCKQKQKGTSYGDKKIKAGNPACHMYKPNK
jgi:trehalose utilization protein